jgi:hypothetical protein
MTDAQKAKLVASKIRGTFPKSSGGLLCYAVVERALLDAFANRTSKEHEICRDTAIEYLKKEMPHLDLSEVSSDWIRRLIRQVGLKL